ncbi:RYamide receptor-like [Porites lutea]|uniref:RYamide receptor-like n=1 Tax=Porites lutea TaxID=51062 RepID=UPI003CC6CFA6
MNNTTETASMIVVCNNVINVSGLKIGLTIGYSLILVVSLAGNSAIGVIFYKTPSLRKPINYLIINMAMSDLIFPFITVPWFLVRFYTTPVDHWLIGGPLGQALCKLIVYVTAVSYGVSSQSLVLIAVDRFVAVVFPLRSTVISRKLFPFVITATWIIALAFYSPWLKSVKVVELKRRSICSVIDTSDEIKSWQIAVFITDYIIIIITIVLLVILYSIIVIKLKQQARPGEQSNNAEKKRAERNRKVLRMACAIVLAFSLCCVPMLTIGFMSLFPKIMSSCGVPIFVFIAIFMYHVNCAVNPIICLIFSSNYRQGLKRLLKC